MRRIRRIVLSGFLATALAFFSQFTFAATVIDLTDQPSTMQVSQGSNHKFTFTTASTITNGSTIAIAFPSGFNLSAITEDDVDISDDGVDFTTFADCTGSEQASASVASTTLTITLCTGDGAAIASGSVVVIEIGTNASSSGLGTQRITNPSAAASYFVNLFGTGGNSGSVILTTTTTGGDSVSATVPSSGGGGDTPPSGGRGGDGDSDDEDDPDDPDPEDPDEPVDPEEPHEPEDPDEPEDPTDPEQPDEPEDPGTPGTPDDPDDDPPFDGGGGEPDPGYDPPLTDAGDPDDPGGGSNDDEVPPTDSDTPDDPEEPVTPPTSPRPTAPSAAPTPVVVATSVMEQIRELPEVQAVVEIAVPVAVVAAVTTTVVLATSFNLLSYLHFMFTSPLLFIARRKRKAFGVVYNAVTKIAIDLAIVRLYDVATNRLVKSTVTDAEGKYFFVVNPGSYRLVVVKNGFVFPSVYLQGVKDDGVFLDVYTGQTIEVTQRDATIAANIPMDVAQGVKQNEPGYVARRRFLRKAQGVFSFSGTFLSILVWILAPSFLTALLAVGQIVVFILFLRLARAHKPRGWGVVYDATTRRPVGNAVVRLFEPKYNKLVETVLTDSLGRYSFLVGPNEYFVSTNRDGYEEYVVRPIDYRQKSGPQPLAVDVPLEPKKRV